MPSAVNIAGTSTRQPGVYVTVNYGANAGRLVRTKRLAVVGDFPFLEQGEAKLVTSQRTMMRLAPSLPYLKQAASCIYTPGNDPAIGQGPTEIYLVGAGVTTQASKALLDADAGTAMTLASTAWGDAGNRTSLALTIDSGKYSFAFLRDGVPESFANIEGVNLFTILYAGSYFDASTVNVSFDGTTFLIAASKATIAFGTATITDAWDGPVIVQPSAAASAGETFTVTVTGTDKSTGQTGVTSVMTWVDIAGGSAAKSTAVAGSPVRSFSAIDTILFARAGGTPAAQTWTVSGNMCSATAGRFPYVKQLTNFLAGGTYPATFTLSSISSLASGVRFADMDPKAATTILSTAKTFTNVKQKIKKSLDGSGLVSTTLGTGGPPALPDSGSAALTINVVASAGTFTRTTGNFLTDGFAPGDVISTTGFSETGNNATKIIASVTATIITVTTITDLVDESGGGNERVQATSITRYLVGGGESAPSSGDWATALIGLRSTPVSIIGLLTDDATGQESLGAHCDYMWGVGRYECQGWTGTAVGANKTTVLAAALALNSFKVSLVAQEAQIRLLDGTDEWLPAYFYALQHASAMASVKIGEPLTNEALNVLDVRTGTTTWDEIDDIEEMLKGMITVTVPDPVMGFVVKRSLTTHLSDDDPARTAPSAVESTANYCRRVRAKLATTIGTALASATKNRVKSIVLTETRSCKADNEISDFNEQSIDAEQEGDTLNVVSGFAPLYEATFINFMPAIMPQTTFTA